MSVSARHVGCFLFAYITVSLIMASRLYDNGFLFIRFHVLTLVQDPFVARILSYKTVCFVCFLGRF